ncbi:tRNAHis guanylyltransferase [Violaceomyces palustris]|uniref:tRNAHis guanylyltransferase n=1 Tax=Violaceomyces palustris TaxID=1673888 RepID=A0ACD0P1W3_9BASI|nr:tRNAHis guanylyltransferase [Violaceomyces palustris]
MAGSRFAYVRNFELPDPVLPDTHMVIRIDGKGFHKFSKAHEFIKPNDPDALELMNQAARHVMKELQGDVTMAFGESDEYSFLLKKSCRLYSRRNHKITTHVVSLFTSAYVFYWPQYFPEKPLLKPPTFDGRLVPYPTEKHVTDYFAWRQADTHINNMYNTVFWALVQQGGQTESEATETLKGTLSSEKQEIMFSRFAINYDRLPAIFRRGTTLVWGPEYQAPARSEDDTAATLASSSNAAHETVEKDKDGQDGKHDSTKKGEGEAVKPFRTKPRKPKMVLRTLHVDIIGNRFWKEPKSSQGRSREQLVETSGKSGGNVQGDGPWFDEDRLQCDGMGLRVFLD